MLEFSWEKRNKSGVPIISAAEMDLLAEHLVGDYKQGLLKEAQPINYEHFLQFYLEADLLYADITPDQSILGLTSFDTGVTTVFDHYEGKEKNVEVIEGSIILDNHLLAKEKEGRLRFTALHEGSHWWCHRDVFAKDRNQLSLFETDNRAVIKCRSTSIENFAYRRCVKSDDWMEYQADYMASAIAMPKTPFIVTAKKLLGDNPQSFVIQGRNTYSDKCIKEELIEPISATFGVSRQAAEIKLKHFGFIKDLNKILRDAQQTVIC